MKKRLTAVLLALCLIIGSGIFAVPARAASFTVYVTGNTLKVYSRVSTSSSVLGTMAYGESMTCVAHNDTWAAVKNAGGKLGYCKISGLSVSDPNNISKKAYVTTDNTPVYRRPETSASVMMKLSKGAAYTAVAVTPDQEWVRLKNGKYYGYVQAARLSLTPPADDEEEAPEVSLPEETEVTVYVIANTLKAYSRPSSSSSSLGTMSFGESMTLLSKEDGWGRVRNSAGAVGYCKLNGLSETNPNSLDETIYINADNVKVYRKPVTSSGVMQVLRKNSSYTCVAMTTDGEWLRLKNGKYYGYIQAKYATNVSLPEEEEEFEALLVYVTDTLLKVYKEPSETSDLMGTMSFGQSLTLVAVDDGWATVRNANGAQGYCLYGGLSKNNPNNMQATAYVAEGGAKMYSAPREDASVISTHSVNDTVSVVAVTEDEIWARISRGSGKYGYMLTENLSQTRIPENNSSIEDISPVTVYISDTTLVFYSQNSTDASVLGTMSFGESITCTGKGDGWARVKNASGTVGYCKLSGLTKTNPNTAGVTLYAQSSGVKVYKKASTSASVLMTLDLNARVTGVAVSSDNSWVRLKSGSNYGYARSENFSTSAVEDEQESTVIEKIIKLAKAQLGVPYVYAAQSPSAGFDCSGFTYYVFKNAAGITLKRTAYTQGYNKNYPTIESRSDLKAGDLVFFNTVSDGDDDLCDHVGIYLGSNQFIHASSVRGEVTISSLGNSSSDYYYRTFSWGKRIIS